MSASSFRAPARVRRQCVGLGVVLGAALLTLTACGGSSGAGSGGGGDGEVVAVATTTQIGSVLDEIAQCNGGSATSVMGPGDDPHDMAVSSQQVAEMTQAGLVFSNGLALEAGMGSALRNAQADGAEIIEVAPEVDPLPFGTGSHGDHDHGGHDHGHAHADQDPHFWMDVARMADAAEMMGERLAAHKDDEKFAECGRQVAEDLRRTDEKVATILAQVPEDKRTIMVDHDAYGYFADAYGFEVSGIVVPGGSTDGTPSSKQMAELSATVKDGGADALLTSAGSPMGEIEALGGEAGGEVPVVELYEAGIGPEDSEASTYRDAMVHNARTLAEELGAR